MSGAVQETVPAATAPRDERQGARLTQGWLLLGLGLAMLAAMLVVTIFAPLVAPYDASMTSPDSLAPASAAHWLGTDSIGRDVLSRLIVGGPPARRGPSRLDLP